MLKLGGYRRYVDCVRFSHDSALVVWALDNETIGIWSIKSGQRVRLLEGHASIIYFLAFSFDSARVVSRASGGMVRIWSASTGKCEKIIEHTWSCPQIELNLQSSLSGYIARYTERSGVGMSYGDDAVTWNGRKVLWLPFNCRPSGHFAVAVSGSTIAFGSVEGKVAILKLSPDCLGV